MRKTHSAQLRSILGTVMARSKWLTAAVVLTAAGAVVTALLPPLVLEHAVDLLAAGRGIPFTIALLYVGLTAVTCLLDASRESLLIRFGQNMTHQIRSAMCGKLSRLSGGTLAKQEPGAVTSRWISDVDTIETLFSAGIISMFADVCKVIGIFAILFRKNPGLAFALLALVPGLFAFTRHVQKRMLAAQMERRAAEGKAANHIPETISCIRTIHALRRERYMQETYGRYIQDGYNAVEKTSFYDSIYSPVILIINGLVVSGVMLLSAAGSPELRSFFGMSVGTAVAVTAYIGAVFGPLESIGMEIQTIQSAIAGVRRIDEFLSGDERWAADPPVTLESLVRSDVPCVEFRGVTFGYAADAPVLRGLQFAVNAGERVTLTGRTGAGKSTVFQLLLGQYRPWAGRVLLYGRDAAALPDPVRRQLFGYVAQTFRRVPGTVLDQITLFDRAITRQRAEQAAETVGMHDAISALEHGYDTPCTPELFSQGQWQLLSIARAIASEPKILLLDEITAELDADTERTVLEALQKAAENRTVLSISHRLLRQMDGRTIRVETAV